MKHLILILLIFGSTLAYTQETSYICGAGSKTFQASATGGTAPITYVWTAPGGSTTTGAAVSASIAGVWTWTATDAVGCTATGTHTLVIEAEPTVTINAVNSCSGAPQTISATGVPAGYIYSWNFGSGATPATSTSSSASVTYSTTGTKTISLAITKLTAGSTNGCGAECEWNYSTTITVGNLTGGSSCF